MKWEEGESRGEYLKRVDRRALRVLLILLVISSVAVLANLTVSGISSDIISVGIAMVNFTLITVGIIAWVYRGELGIIHTSRYFRWAVVAAIIGGVAITIYFSSLQESVWIGVAGWSVELRPYADPISFLVTSGLVSFGCWGGILGFTSVGFGVVWLTATTTERALPWLLRTVRGFTGERSDPLIVKIIAWFLDVPNVLDASELRIDESKMNDRFPTEVFIRAVGWELFIGTMVAIYFSLNPLVLESLGLVEAMSILSTVSIVIPLIVLPWFALTSINARIAGVKRDFMLFNGIRSRILQTFLALGTIALLIRLALMEYQLGDLLIQFLNYYVTLSMLAILFTFVYFNYFEQDLAASVRERYGER